MSSKLRSRYWVEIRDDEVVLGHTSYSETEEFQIPEIKLVGECTNQNGPYAEDWFLCLCDESGWLEIPVEADGFSDLLDELGTRLGFYQKLELFNSADFCSRIIWPVDCVGAPLFQYKSRWWRFTANQSYSSIAKGLLGF